MVSPALERAYASNENTPTETIQINHPNITGGVIRLAKLYSDYMAETEEGPGVVTFSKSAIDVNLPEKSTDGRQDLIIAIDNTDLTAYNEIMSVVNERFSTPNITPATVIYRQYLVTTAPDLIYTFNVTGVSINRNVVNLRCSYTPLVTRTFPFNRYSVNNFPGLRYV